MALIAFPDEEPEEPSGEQLRDEGMDLAMSRKDIPPYAEDFRDTVDGLPKGSLFTSEDITARIGLPSGEVGMNQNNAVGAIMNGLARRGVISKTGERRKSRRAALHASEIAIWRKE